MQITLPDIQNVLIIKPSAIGDVVHTLPVLGLLRERFESARISWLVTPVCAGLLDGHPMLHEVIRFDRKGFGSSYKKPAKFIELARFTNELADRKFDLVLDLQGLLRSAWLARATRAPVRVGFANAREFSPLFYTHRVEIDSMEQHALDRYLKLAGAVGCRIPDEIEFPFATDETDRESVIDLLGDLGPFAVLLPGTNWATKRWPVSHFTSLVQPLRERHGLRTVLAGGADVVELSKQMRVDLDLAGQTTLRQLTALLERAKVVVANDSGPMHIAAALGRPLVTLFGPTNPVRTGPFRRDDTMLRLNLPCSPCYARTCVHQSCMKWLTPTDVLRAVDVQLTGM